MNGSDQMSRLGNESPSIPRFRLWVKNLGEIERAYGVSTARFIRDALKARLQDATGADAYWSESDALATTLGYAGATSVQFGGRAPQDSLSLCAALSMPIDVGRGERVCPLVQLDNVFSPDIPIPGRWGLAGQASEWLTASSSGVWAEQFCHDMTQMAGFLDSLCAGELHLAFQPVVQLMDVSAVLYEEVLLRRGGAGLGREIQAVERGGVAWILDRSVVWAGIRILERYPAKRIACNVSGASFYPDRWWFEVIEFLSSQPDVAARLVIEITETSALRDKCTALELVNALREVGVLIAVDDVGVGSCTLAFLLEASPAFIKIDRAILGAAMETSEGRRRFLTLLRLCDSCTPCVVVEGVERSAELDFLRQFEEVRAVQGFAIARPDAMAEWLSPELRALQLP